MKIKLQEENLTEKLKKVQLCVWSVENLKRKHTVVYILKLKVYSNIKCWFYLFI